MHTLQIGILEPDNFSKNTLRKLKKIGEIYLFKNGDLFQFIRDKEVIFTRFKFFISKAFLDKAPKLRYICTPTTGLNHMDVKEIQKRKIEIISLKGERKFLSNIRATPEHILGLTLSLLRNYKYAFLSKKNNEWNNNKYVGYEIYNNKIGIIGFGRVGRILAKYFQCLGADVFFYDINKITKEEYGAKKVSSIRKLIIGSNIILLCASYHDKNRSFFNKKYIDLLRNKYFINASRGELIDEKYLLKKIRQKFFRGIALDVVSEEFNRQNNLRLFLKLTGKRNFILTPHIAGATHESRTKTEEFIVKKFQYALLKQRRKKRKS